MKTLIEKLENRLYSLRKKQRFEEDECFALEYKDNANGFEQALNIIKQHSYWIPCSERLPNNEKKYLVLCDNGSVWTGHYNLPSKPNEWYLHGWAPHNGYHPFIVTHFMELPQPPSEVQP